MAAAAGPVTGQDRTPNTKKGHNSSDTLHTSNAGLQVSTAANDGAPLEPATSSPSISSAYIHDEASTSSLSVIAGSYISASGTSRHDMDSGDTSPNPSQGTSQFSVDDGRNAVHQNTLSPLNTTLHPTDSSSHTSDFQLQLWLYETSPTNQTLAEHLEQTSWEDNYPTQATAPTNRRTTHSSGM